MRIRQILPAALLALAANAQNNPTTLLGSSTGGTTVLSGTGTPLGDAQTANATYSSYTSTITFSSLTTGTSNSTNGTSSTKVTNLIGGTASRTGNATSSSTSETSRPTANSQPCNGYVEFCDRKYSNITYVAAHNFPFIRSNNAARNQEYGIVDQLNDGIRMLQAQAHYVNGTTFFCHTSCDILNAGTVQSQFELLVNWLQQNPFEVVTILLGNYNWDSTPPINGTQFVPAIQNSGLEPYLYQPPAAPMTIDQWPTTQEMIITGKRVVLFMDYNPEQQKTGYILDEWAYMWETPYSPTDPAFPCTQQRPNDQDRNTSLNRLYLANHNLNVDFSDLGINLLVPNVAQINETNAVSGFSSLGETLQNCTASWDGRPPNFLLVDFYNYGNVPGSVFEVAARANNVTYNGKCCGNNAKSGAADRLLSSAHLLITLGVVLVSLIL